MMARMLSQLPLPLLPAGAAEIAPGVGLVAGDDGGLVTVHGLATFAWDAGDEAGRRLAAVHLVRLRAASQGQVAGAFGVDPGTIWRWDQALAAGGVAGLVPARRGPKGASKLTPQLAERIAGLDAAGQTLREIAAATGVSTFSVRNALGRVASGGRPAAARTAEDSGGPDGGDDDEAQGGAVPVLPDPVPRDGKRALAQWGLLGEGAAPVFIPGARYPLAGLLLALPALEGAGLLAAAREVYGRLKDGFYGLTATLLTLEPSGSLLQVGAAVTGVAFSPNGTLLASADVDGAVQLWDTATGQVHGLALPAGSGSPGAATGVAFSPDGTLLAAGYSDGLVRLWNVATGQAHGPALAAGSGPQGGVTGVAFSPDGTLLAAAGDNGTVSLWNPATGRLARPCAPPAR